MERRTMQMVVMVLGLLAMVQQSMELSLKKPLPLLPRKMSTEDSPAFAIVASSSSVEKALNESGYFVPDSYVDLFGRRFVRGTIYGANVVFVRTSSSPSVHVGITVQILADYFNDVVGVVFVGVAGATNETLNIGDVSIPREVGFTGSWEWLSKDSNVVGQLEIGKFNYPTNGENLLGSIKYDEIDIYYKGRTIESFWVYPYKQWLLYASRIKISGGDVVVGLKSSSSDIYVKNPAYREFIFKTFSAATVDVSSAAAGLGAKSNDLRFIALQGISNYAGAGDSPYSATELASKNVVDAVINFIWQATVPRSAHETVDL